MNIPNRYIPEKTKEKIIDRQNGKCANFPGSKLWRIGVYECLLWKYRKGKFDESGYEFDHVIEFCLTKDNNINNLQALCPMCHSVKTKNFDVKDKSLINESEDSLSNSECDEFVNENRNIFRTGCVEYKYDGEKIPIVFDESGDVWMGAIEVVLLLGYAFGAFRNAIRKNVDIQCRKAYHKFNFRNNNFNSHKIFINEPGLYSLMLKSRMKKAKKFSHWVTHEVLPSIRKYGSYTISDEKQKELDYILKKINLLENECKRLSKIKESNGIIYVVNNAKGLYTINVETDQSNIKKISKSNIVHLIKFSNPFQLEACIRICLRKYLTQGKMYKCSLEIIKNAMTKYIHKINRLCNGKSGSKTNKRKTDRNLVKNTLIALKKKEHMIRSQNLATKRKSN